MTKPGHVPAGDDLTADPMSRDLLSRARGAVERAGLTGEVAGWLGLGVGALGLAGIFALLLAASRIPGAETVFPWPVAFFEKGLVIHVVFSFVVWFLALFGALLAVATAETSTGTPRLAGLGRVAVWLGVGAFVLLAVPALLDRGEPSLNNYVPAIIDPLYYAGLAALGLSLTLAVVRLAANLRRPAGAARDAGALHDAAMAGGLIYAAAIACFLAALLPRLGDPATVRFNEDVFWGGGHALQYLNTAMMLAGWAVLASMALDRPAIPRPWFRAVLVLATVPALGMPFLYAVFPLESGELIRVFTDLQYGLAPPALVAGLILIVAFRRRPEEARLPWDDAGFLCLVLSFLTFAVGGYLGLFVDGADTRTPAHYHAVIAAVNLSLIGLFLRFLLPVTGRAEPRGRAVRTMVWLYALGQTVAAVGLFLAGGYGAPRKTAGAAQGIEALGAKVGLWMNGAGAAVAVIGGVMFIWIAARALLRR